MLRSSDTLGPRAAAHEPENASIVALVNAVTPLSTEPRRRPGGTDPQKTTVGVEFALLQQTSVEPDLGDASSPKGTPRRGTGWWRRAEPDHRPGKLIKIVVVQYDGITIHGPDTLSRCFRPSDTMAQIDRHRHYHDCSHE